MSQIGKNVKKIRNVRGLSQQAFADLFQLTRGNISSYEEFRAEPKLDVMLRIAKYFGIPLADFIEKDLSVNELLHYNTELVLETEKLKLNQQLARIPYIPILYINDFAAQYKNEDFINDLPHIILPGNSRFRQIALEVDNQEALPSGFDFHTGDILVYEQVVKENAHRIVTKLGMMPHEEGLKTGVYKEEAGTITLSLNEWINYPFDMDSDNQYWVLKALYTQIL
jgi:transcriptional regulator with XRE-family HTH domain